MNSLDHTRARIARGIRQLRQERRWSQRELATRLGLSQSRLSELEGGAGSFSAEQLIAVLQLFNVGISHFAPARSGADDHLQNALERFGASHLAVVPDTFPSDHLLELDRVLQEAVLNANARLITAVAPVLVRNIDLIDLNRLARRLIDIGFERRLFWLVENVRAALELELARPLQRAWIGRYRRAGVVLSTFLAAVAARATSVNDIRSLDLLDPTIRSQRTIDELRASASPMSDRWGIVTSLQPEDFASALAQARPDA